MAKIFLVRNSNSEVEVLGKIAILYFTGSKKLHLFDRELRAVLEVAFFSSSSWQLFLNFQYHTGNFVFPVLYWKIRISSVILELSRSFQIFPDFPKIFQIFPDFPRFSQISPDFPRFFQNFPDFPRFHQILPYFPFLDLPIYSQIFPDLARSFPIFPKFSRFSWISLDFPRFSIPRSI